MRALRVILAAALLGLLAGVASCGDDDGEESATQTRARGIRFIPPEALEGKREPARAGAGRTVQAPAGIANLSTGQRAQIGHFSVGGPAGDRSDYATFLPSVIPLIEEFWRKTTRQLSARARYEPPGRTASYAGTGSPGCGGQKTENMAKNAYYCPVEGDPDACPRPSYNQAYCAGGDLVAWDEPGLMFPFFRDIGDLAPALVMAHEWGHLAQYRLYPAFDYRTSIRRELQADCYAGAWAAEMSRQGRVNVGEFNEAFGLFYEIGGPGEAWVDPKSHGNKFQRLRSFTQGFEEDAQGCVGARYDRVLKRLGLEPEQGEGQPQSETAPTTTPTAG